VEIVMVKLTFALAQSREMETCESKCAYKTRAKSQKEQRRMSKQAFVLTVVAQSVAVFILLHGLGTCSNSS
jgi:lipid-binding SYLF domain-containing protein